MRLITLNVSHIFGLKYNTYFDFSDKDLIAIIGENGSGKSSIMDSIRLAFFGEASPARGVDMKDYIRKGADEGSVELVFESNNGTKYRITRKLKKTSRNVSTNVLLEEMSRNGSCNPIASSLTDVAAAASSILLYGEVREGGDDKDIVKQAKAAFDISAFISQGNINKILNVTPAERLKLVSSALNIQDGETLKENVKELKKLAEKEIEASRIRIESIEQALSELGNPATMSQQLSSADTGRRQAEADRRDIAGIMALLQTLKDNYARASNAKSRLESLQPSLKSAVRLNSLGNVAAALADIKSAARNFKSAAVEANRRAAELPRLRTEYAAGQQELKRTKEGREANEAIQHSSRGVAMLYPLMESAADTRNNLTAIQGDIEKAAARKAELDNEAIALQTEYTALLDQARIYKFKLAIYKSDEAAQRISAIKRRIADVFIDMLREIAGADIIDLNKFEIPDPEALLKQISGSQFGNMTQEIRDLQSNIISEDAIPEADREAVSAVNISAQELPNIIAESEGKSLRITERLAAIKTEAGSTDSRLSAARSTESKYINNIKTTEQYIAGTMSRYNISVLPDIKEAYIASDKLKQAEDAGRRLAVKYDAIQRHIGELATAINTGDHAVRTFEASKAGYLSQVRKAADKAVKAAEICVAGGIDENISGAINAARVVILDKVPTDDVVRRMENHAAAVEGDMKTAESNIEAALAEYSRRNDLPAVNAQSIQAVYNRYSTAAAECERRSAEYNTKYGRLLQQIEQHKRLSREYARCVEVRDKLMPLQAYVKRFASMADGNNFTRYISDRTMELLLGGVNAKLAEADIPWRIFSDNGILNVKDADGMERPVAGMSGGESTLVSILLLRQISNLGCLWLDESLTMLDENKLQEVLETLRSTDRNTQIMVVTHDQDLARSFPVVWRMDSGSRADVQERTTSILDDITVEL